MSKGSTRPYEWHKTAQVPLTCWSGIGLSVRALGFRIKYLGIFGTLPCLPYVPVEWLLWPASASSTLASQSPIDKGAGSTPAPRWEGTEGYIYVDVATDYPTE